MRIFKKRGVDYNEIKEKYLQSLEEEYYKNPKKCLYCGKPIPYDDPERFRKNSVIVLVQLLTTIKIE